MKVLSRLFRKRTSQLANAVRPAFCEPLEERQLMALMNIAQVVADNRGQVLIALSKAPDITTVTRSSVQMYTAGPDGKLATADDTFVSIGLHFSPSINRITINGYLPANTPYRIKIVGSRMKAQDGTFLDGEYKGSGPSGNGVQGGNFEMQAVQDTGSVMYVRMSTSKGVITLQMFQSQKPTTVANFLSYANSGAYDNIVYTRSENTPEPFVVQLGSLILSSGNQLFTPTPHAAIATEFTKNGIVHNTLGTVAFALSSNQSGILINSATNQFFFNMNDNRSSLEGTTAGFTVFARVANASSLTVLTTINNMDTVDLSGVAGPFNSTLISTVPVNNKNLLTISNGVVTGNFNPSRDMVIVGRTAALMKTGALVIPH
ncbi:MAG TPA: peptidylprolyl isomerase [Tepidisphaeraceae bacterium]|nr:peptidylprolyl isomerase [Tepidisphaeraceae bacterium]